ncbi:ribbon-helix-helix protein, CopG family [Microbacterium sp.]|uniref:type II toxin-antitoxin system VapB family antitoxin n=1 Tax=Microbacterium sp. TaxID=51671 RepID=UPI0039E6368C
MTDILIRNVPAADVRRLDEKAAALGLSRAEYLRRRIIADAHRPVETALSREDFAQFEALADEEFMAAAWN